MKKILTMFMPVLAAFILFTIPVSAHVTVKPESSSTGAWETYTIKVPVEKDIPTTKVALKMPEGVEFSMYEPVPGWTIATEKDQDGKVTTVTWTAGGEGLKAGEFAQFSFIGKNSDQAGEAAWDAYQYYKDGSIVEWTGDKDSDLPHSITTIVQGEGADDHHGGDVAKEESKKEEAEAVETENTTTLPLTLSVIALILSLAAVIITIIRKK
ncbi:YcnI family protein [Metabacillus fastidiosus]|uniref:YcnI family copper-binding membrane protein n=1 Tax=Metabacillus fastidiosus TaxID=1458 RepID=UPI003D2B6920